MAITQTGSITRLANSSGYSAASGTISAITVPSDAELMLIAVSCYHGTSNTSSASGSFDIGGNASVGVGGGLSSNWQCALHYILQPATGTQNLDWQWGGGAGSAMGDPAVLLAYWFYKGVDTASPIRDSDGAQASGTTATTPTLTAASGDLIVAAAASFNVAQADVTFSFSGATVLSNLVNYTYADLALATASPSGNQTVGYTCLSSEEGGIAAFVFKAAAGGVQSGAGSATGTGTASAVGSGGLVTQNVFYRRRR